MVVQGWKLFAEAHDVRPGDHLAFELVHPTRLVVQFIKRKAEATPQQTSPASSTLG